MPDAPTDRALLFGALAVQTGLTTQEGLRAALGAWSADRSKPFEEALQEGSALSAGERACLEALVEQHLLRHGEAGSALRTLALPPPPLGATLPLSSASEAAPSTQAPAGAPRFDVLRLHAAGGLGEVFVALDRELNREVALKQIRVEHSHDADSRSRFLLEAEVTGRLEHPGIVPVYGLGTHPDGRPYYAMRFIQGDSLQQALDRFHQSASTGGPHSRSLERRGLLGRFVAVCNAVAYAHARGILHRDLKPDNVMLGPFGETLVVDWGLAKALGAPAPDIESPPTQGPMPLGAGHTQVGAVVGTPTFMSPEQAAGGEVSARSDVYSLGATLYVLLTGRPPFEEGNVFSTLERVRRGEVVPPRHACPDVPAPLEAVCLKAMARALADRYASAAELAGEVERWLADEPVRAYAEPWRVRAGRWARRHRTLVSAGVVLLAAGLVGLSLGLWAVRAEQGRTARQRDQAQANLGRADANLALAKKAVDDCYLLATEDPLLQQENMRPVRKLLLEKALPFYQGFQALRPDDRDLQAELGRNHFRVATITSAIGRTADALRSYEEARRIQAGLAEAHPEVLAYQAALARTLHGFGTYQYPIGEYADSARSCAEAVRLRAGLLNASPEDVAYQRDLAWSLNNLGNALQEVGRHDDARQSYERSRALRTRLAEADPASLVYQSDLGQTQHNLALLQQNTGQREAALKTFQEALRIRAGVAKAQPDVSNPQARVALTYRCLGMLQSRMGKRADAVRTFEEARAIWARLSAAHPAVTAYRRDLASTYHGRGEAQTALGRHSDAFQSYDEARRLRVQLLAADPESRAIQSDLAQTHHNLGILHGKVGRAREAIASYERALPLRVRLAADSPKAVAPQWNLGWTCTNLAALHQRAGRRELALKYHLQALPARERVVADRPGNAVYLGELLATYHEVINLESDFRKFTEALAHLRAAVPRMSRLAELQPKNVSHQNDLALLRHAEGTLLGKLGRKEESVRVLERAVAQRARLAAQAPGDLPAQANLAHARADLGAALVDGGQLDKGLEHLGAALRGLEVLRQPRHKAVRPALLKAHAGRAFVLDKLGRPQEALADWDRAIELAGAEERPLPRALRAQSRARAGDHARGVAEAEELLRGARSGEELYHLACAFALASPHAGRDQELPPPLRKLREEAYAARAMALLKQAGAAGYFTGPEKRAALARDADLAPLRGRADFKKFLGGP